MKSNEKKKKKKKLGIKTFIFKKNDPKSWLKQLWFWKNSKKTRVLLKVFYVLTH